MNIFAPRPRRYSTGFSPLATTPGPLPRLTPRVSQLRQEECADMSSREVNHEREVHAALQISQSWEDLTLDTESWSVKSESELSNPLQVSLPTNIISCSSPSPTRYNYCMPNALHSDSNWFHCAAVELAYGCHMACRRRQPDEHFKPDAQCRRLRCAPAHWAR